MEFFDKLKLLRKEKSISQKELGNALGLNQTTISGWESGKGYPNICNLIALAKFFDVKTNYLLGLQEYS